MAGIIGGAEVGLIPEQAAAISDAIALTDVCANKRRANLEYYRMARMLAK